MIVRGRRDCSESQSRTLKLHSLFDASACASGRIVVRAATHSVNIRLRVVLLATPSASISMRWTLGERAASRAARSSFGLLNTNLNR
ncbi:Uncharacterised protein [Mycobacterium tuberculosis]|nr:Uncharacterised protein [Mycobacterium tuberculosis]